MILDQIIHKNQKLNKVKLGFLPHLEAQRRHGGGIWWLWELGVVIGGTGVVASWRLE